MEEKMKFYLKNLILVILAGQFISGNFTETKKMVLLR